MLQHIQPSLPQVLDSIIHTHIEITITNSLHLAICTLVLIILTLRTLYTSRLEHNTFHTTRLRKTLITRPVPERRIRFNQVTLLRHEEHIRKSSSMDSEHHISVCQLHYALRNRQFLQNDVVVIVLSKQRIITSYIISHHQIDLLDKLVMILNESERRSPNNR